MVIGSRKVRQIDFRNLILKLSHLTVHQGKVLGHHRALGSQMQMMISDVTYALESDLAADLLEMLDLPFPEEDDDSQPGGDIDLLSDLGMSAMELEALCDDPELFPDEQLDAIASRLGFGNQFAELFESQ